MGDLITSYIKIMMVLQLGSTLIAHFLCDFVLQDDETAKGKSSNIVTLLKHCATYTAGMMLFTAGGYIFRDDWTTIMLHALPTYFLSHFIIDFVSSKLTTHYWINENRHMFFNVIGVDQLLHTMVCVIFWIAFL